MTDLRPPHVSITVFLYFAKDFFKHALSFEELCPTTCEVSRAVCGNEFICVSFAPNHLLITLTTELAIDIP